MSAYWTSAYPWATPFFESLYPISYLVAAGACVTLGKIYPYRTLFTVVFWIGVYAILSFSWWLANYEQLSIAAGIIHPLVTLFAGFVVWREVYFVPFGTDDGTN